MTNQLREHDDLRRTAAVAADYTQLQGLINVTTGLGLVLWGLGRPEWCSWVIAVGVVVGTAYYRRRFGRAVGRGSLLASLGVTAAAFVVCTVGYLADARTGWPVLVLPLLGAACFVAAYRIGLRHVGVTAAHRVAVGLLVLSAFAPLVGLGGLGARTGVLSLGLALAVVGVADHVRLVTTMKPVPRD
jgi:hypothetical protein